MTELHERIKALLHDARNSADTPTDGRDDEGMAAPANLHRMSRKLGKKVLVARRTSGRILKLVTALVALGTGSAWAQTQATAPAQAVVQDSSLATSPVTTNRFDRSFAGSDRLGVSVSPVPDAKTSRQPLAAYREGSLRHRGPGVALMLVGAAGIVTGLLIDESLITILGAGTGLIGLYLYLR